MYFELKSTHARSQRGDTSVDEASHSCGDVRTPKSEQVGTPPGVGFHKTRQSVLRDHQHTPLLRPRCKGRQGGGREGRADGVAGPSQEGVVVADRVEALLQVLRG